LGAIVAISLSTGVAAHGNKGLVVEPPVAEPGSAIKVHGSYLWTDRAVKIVLLAIDGTMWTLGEGSTGGNGDLETNVVLPPDLPDATYSILARAANGEDAHVELVIRGAGGGAQTGIVVGAAAGVVALVVAFTAAVVIRRRRAIAA
jgi:hypothetical protein